MKRQESTTVRELIEILNEIADEGKDNLPIVVCGRDTHPGHACVNDFQGIERVKIGLWDQNYNGNHALHDVDDTEYLEEHIEYEEAIMIIGPFSP